MSELKKERLQFKDLYKLILNIPRSKEMVTNFCGQKELQKQTFEVAYTDGKVYTYNELLGAYRSYEKILEDVPQGSVVAVRGEFDVNTIGLMKALLDHRCIYVPISRAVIDVAYYLKTAKVEYYMNGVCEKNQSCLHR